MRNAVTKVRGMECLKTYRNFLDLNIWITSRHKRQGVFPTEHQREGLVCVWLCGLAKNLSIHLPLADLTNADQAENGERTRTNETAP